MLVLPVLKLDFAGTSYTKVEPDSLMKNIKWSLTNRSMRIVKSSYRFFGKEWIPYRDNLTGSG